ncbi:MAG: hypothetical protein IJT02_09130 [Synergistaceae bacterium]|nr:hypothetical protein [Synergistaceae bacterium]
MKRSALTLVELIAGLAILALIAGVTSLNTDFSRQTSVNEAAKVAKFITSSMVKADNLHSNFTLAVESQSIKITWMRLPYGSEGREEVLEASRGCSYTVNNANIEYSYSSSAYSKGGTIAVRGRGDPHYVILASIGGRVRTSDTPPRSDEDNDD